MGARCRSETGSGVFTTFLIESSPCRERSLSRAPCDSGLVLGFYKAVTIRGLRKVPSTCVGGGDLKVITDPNLLLSLAFWMGATGPAESEATGYPATDHPGRDPTSGTAAAKQWD